MVRSQIPAAVSAGRYAENQAIPSESGRNSTRRSWTLLAWRFFDADRVVAFAPRAHFRAEPARDKVPGRAARGPGSGASGSRKCASSAAAPAGSRLRGFVHHGPGVRPGDRAGLQRLQGQRQLRFVRASDSASKVPAACSLTVRAHASSDDDRPTPGRCGPARMPPAAPSPGSPRVVRGQQHLQRRHPGFHPGHPGEPVQAGIRQIPQRISAPELTGVPGRINAGRISYGLPGAGQSSQRGNRRRGEPPRPPWSPHSNPCFP